MASLVALAMVMASGIGCPTGRAGCVQPRGELTQRISVQVCDSHPPSRAHLGQ